MIQKFEVKRFILDFSRVVNLLPVGLRELLSLKQNWHVISILVDHSVGVCRKES